MSEPKFHVGQKVAVFCWPEYDTIIPSTTVTAVDYCEEGDEAIGPDGLVFCEGISGWEYLVEDDEYWLSECYLRALQDDDYLDPATTDTSEPTGERA